MTGIAGWRASTVPRWMILGEWRAHPLRILTAIAAIAIGVALGFAVHLVNASALNRFARGLAAVNGGADLRVEAAGGRGFDEAVYPRVARLAGVAGASPVVTLRGRIDQQTVDVLGLDVLRAAIVTPGLLPRPAHGGEVALFDPQSVFLSGPALGHRKVGSAVQLVVDGQPQNFVIAGMVPGAADRAIAVLDIAAAQDRFGSLKDKGRPTAVRAVCSE